MIKFLGEYLKIDSKNNSLIIKNFDGYAEKIYYGKKLHDSEDYSLFENGNTDAYGRGSCNDYITLPQVMSSTADCNNRESMVMLFYKGIFSSRFVYQGAKPCEGFSSPLPTARNKGETVCLTYVDEVSKATLNQYFTVFEDSDVIATHTELVNTTDSEIFVNRLMSLQLDFNAESADVVTFDGKWNLERVRHDQTVKAGKLEVDSKLGMSSPLHNPFIMVKVNGDVMGFNLVWSGNHKEIVEVNTYRKVRILTGMNDHALNYKLEVGEKLVSPEAVFVSARDEDTITSEMQKFSLNHIVNPNFAYKERPVLINNWEGTYFNFTGEKILNMAQKAAECGIEMFVLDDGWFGKRDDDRSGLGDWYDNVKKTGGLKNIADGIHALGMKFGLWVEPEMICIDSDLFRAHPEWAQTIPGVKPLERRQQLYIDIANPEVANYLADTLIKLFKDVGVDYVKWDHNRQMSDVYSHALENQGEYFYNYYVNQTAMLGKIVEACPNVLFESCSSGGCRYDLGMQYFMSQNWGSDNTNAFDRLTIQEGTLVGYPQSSMGAHVSATSHCNVSLESRFNVASIGAFGYEFDITKASKEKIDTIKKQVAYYKEHKKLLQYGNYYRLGESLTKADIGGWITVSDDKEEAMAVIIDKLRFRDHERLRYQLKGLDPDALYKVTMRPQTNVEGVVSFTAYGDALCSYGVDFGDIVNTETDRTSYRDTFASRMFYIKKIK